MIVDIVADVLAEHAGVGGGAWTEAVGAIVDEFQFVGRAVGHIRTLIIWLLTEVVRVSAPISTPPLYTIEIIDVWFIKNKYSGRNWSVEIWLFHFLIY